jgi:hypothetical protein
MKRGEFHNVDFRKAESNFAEGRQDWRGPLSFVSSLIGFVTMTSGVWPAALLCSARGFLLGAIAAGVARGTHALPVSGILAMLVGAPCALYAIIGWTMFGTHLHAWC